MKIPSFRFGGLMLAALFSIAAVSSFAGEPAATVFNQKSGLLAGWSSIVWGNLTVEPSKTVSKEAGGVSLKIMPTAEATPYAGLQIMAEGSGGLPLNDALRTKGAVYLYLRNGSDLAGTPAADQLVQVMLAFQPDGSKTVNGSYAQVALESVPADAKTASGWQLVKVSIPEQLKGRVDAATPVKLHGVYIQYIDKPLAGYFVGECTVVDPSAK